MTSVLFAAFALAAAAEVKTLDKPFLSKGETLACFGDSITKGEYYVPILAERLAKDGINVINLGRGGDKTPTALTRLGKVSAAKPDAVLIFFGANDSVIGRGRWSDEPKVDPITYRDNLVWMIHTLRLTTDIRRFAVVTPPGCCEGESMAEYGPVIDRYAVAAREAVDIANQLGARNGHPAVVMIPLDTEFGFYRKTNLKDPRGLLLTCDGIHFSATGSRIAADVIMKALNLAR